MLNKKSSCLPATSVVSLRILLLLTTLAALISLGYNSKNTATFTYVCKENYQHIWQQYPQHFRKGSRKRQWCLKPKKSKRQKKIFGPASSCCCLSCQREGWSGRCVSLKPFLLFHTHYYPLFSPWLALIFAAPAAPSRPLTELEMSLPFYSALRSWLSRSTSCPSAGEEPEKEKSKATLCDFLFWVTDAFCRKIWN